MIKKENGKPWLEEYIDNLKRDVKISVTGSHSALDICDGAFTEGIKNIVIVAEGREKTYSKYFLYRKTHDNLEKGFINEIIPVKNFTHILNKNVQNKLRDKKAIMVPNRSLTSYMDIKEVERSIRIPFFGSRDMLYLEEREMDKNYYWLLEKANIHTPERIEGPEAIDSLVMVKLPHAVKKLERGFFTCSSFREYREKSGKLIKRHVITTEDLKNARIERYIIGPVFNFDFFWSPLDKELELLGIDWRFETSLDGHVRLPADEQLSLSDAQKIPEYTVVGHASSTLRESSLEKIFEIAESFVSIAGKEFSKGIIGPFTLQTCIDKDLNPYVYDLSPRIGGGTNIHMYTGHPYGNSLWRREMSTGRRIALEVKRALDTGTLKQVLT
ncbi:MAG: formate--phosphoribosylaminoimidazolecarboxamide ligase family protein [Candidatus Thermoplasmatota archaeon]|jgi:5-formaminoimidazole-4-carboxamide-1-(beta)-D-ribofuranosyl 5'-monophosphate synthetase|nr:formate--phosphoribosylaminoimidazolecarboxamide ligase family protein [Candidatus Thermoplasmatota archaeon]MCL5963613.1 formate--phosphoribosylaminoimidazolecarboxamide ligase family protein [Candidatus Thermoplasmatota archaeon]